MSLLMDALRKAEEAKRAAAQNPGTPTLEAAPLDFGAADTPLAELGLEPMPVKSLPAEVPPDTAPPDSPRPADQSAQRHAIQNAFAAKATPKRAEDKAFLLALVCVVGLAALGIGGYVWWQMQPHNALTTTANMPVAMAPPTALPPVPEAQAQPEHKTLPAAPAAAEAVERSEPRPTPVTAAPSPDPIRITRSQPRVSPLLEQGYNALQQGNLPQAQQAYERMLAADPKSADAMYGLAAIALQKQQPALAEDYYLRILESDPRDPYAHAGLAGLRGQAGSSNAESRLKTLIADQPGVAPLHFALGNLYAQDQRWRDAQQSYFLAYKNDSGNPDITYNLAVSLDQLHQNKLAAQYYTEALRLASVQPGAFNREQVQQRLRELQATSGS